MLEGNFDHRRGLVAVEHRHFGHVWLNPNDGRLKRYMAFEKEIHEVAVAVERVHVELAMRVGSDVGDAGGLGLGAV